jgi:putative glutamine amidotransferase
LHREEAEVNTRHLQAVASVGAPYRVSAVSVDGVGEAIENEDGTVMGVQFHPERMEESMLPLFEHLVEQARQARAVGAGIP